MPHSSSSSSLCPPLPQSSSQHPLCVLGRTLVLRVVCENAQAKLVFNFHVSQPVLANVCYEALKGGYSTQHSLSFLDHNTLLLLFLQSNSWKEYSEEHTLENTNPGDKKSRYLELRSYLTCPLWLSPQDTEPGPVDYSYWELDSVPQHNTCFHASMLLRWLAPYQKSAASTHPIGYLSLSLCIICS